MYTQLLPECSRMYLTKINGVFGADAFFPPYDESEWKLVYKSETLCENGVSFNFTEYEKN
ncbi:hypothetical protein SDC9_200638 [bioreactor metagenome]|uniref:DHFR domain-containing protein n=1 Tax=bioreactor metagenome TaxID=1076179 RepID=A0A645INQ3_9ZZZZ